MKKLLALLLAALMLLSALPVLAEEDSLVELPEYGMILQLPAEIGEAAFTPMLSDNGVQSRDPFVSVMYLNYFAIPNGAMEDRASQVDANDQEAIANFYKLLTTIGVVVVTNAESLDAALIASSGEGLTDEMNVTEFGVLEPYHYYYITGSFEDYYSNIADQVDTEEVRADVERLNGAMLKALQEAQLFPPEDVLASAIGLNLAIETTDLDGNAVNTLDLFKENKITMVNFWGSWCGYCVDEMPDLAEIHTRLQEKGCGIVGFEYERGVPIEDFKDDAKAIMEESGTNYPNVLAPTKPYDFITGYPVTVFVDSEGNVLTYPLVGPQVQQYENTVDKLLAGEDAASVVEPTSHESGDGEYHIIVTDSEGPVAGVTVQFCDESTCSYQNTDENGIATFRPSEPKAYDVHILQVPDGYAENTEIYRTEDTWSDLNIVIEKAN